MTIGIADLDLAGLPSPQIVEEVSFETIRAALIADFKVRFPEYDVAELESDPGVKLLEVAAYRETLLRARVNDAARANLLAFASAGDLDQMAVFHDVTRLPEESDARFRKRVQLAVAGRSPGGTIERYKSIALSADVLIADVSVWCALPDPTIKVSVLNSLNGGIPYPEQLTAVREALAEPDVQMVNDTIVVQSAVTQTVNVAADVWMLPNTPLETFNGLEAALRASWTDEGGIGRDLSVAWLTARLMRPGIARVAITAPASGAVASPNDAISLGTITLTNKGVEF